MKRVAAYCRVSTDQDDQLNSLESQKRFFEQYINKNLAWQFCGLYVDEGITGTNVNKRTGFKQMIHDAESHQFDLILTKEISRFARNTLDSIFYTRKLKALGVGVFFMNDNIDTLEPDAELRLTIMSSIAQEESRKTSQRVRWGQKRQMEKGVVFGASVFGYHLDGGKLTTNEEESEIVRLIFDLYLNEGMGTHILCKELENRGILSPSGDNRWKNASILRMLKNEKYIGVLKQKKYITTDYLSHAKKVNEGEEEFVIIENNHEPIVDKDVFVKVQKEIVRRRTVTLDKSKHSNRYVWSGKIECAHCNSKFKRRINNKKHKNSQIVWQCAEAIKYGNEKINENNQKIGCNCRSIHEQILQESFLTTLDTIIHNKKRITQELKTAVHKAIAESPNSESEILSISADIAKIGGKKTKLVELFTDNAISRNEYDQINGQYNKQLEVLNDNLLSVQRSMKRSEDLQKRLSGIDKAVDSIVCFKEFSEAICKEILEKVVVESREKISFFINTTNDNSGKLFIPLSITGLEWHSKRQNHHGIKNPLPIPTPDCLS